MTLGIGQPLHAKATYSHVEREGRERAIKMVAEGLVRFAKDNNCEISQIRIHDGEWRGEPAVGGECEVVWIKPQRFKIVDDIPMKDLLVLRAVTRRVLADHGIVNASDKTCDNYIDNIAPETLERMIQEGMRQ